MGIIIARYAKGFMISREIEFGYFIFYGEVVHLALNIIGSFLDNVLSGMITTVAKRNILLNWYSFFIYIIYVILLIWNVRIRGHEKTAVLAGLTLLAIVGNVTLVSLVIFCQTRYTIYNMGLFYICMVVMLYNLFRHWRLASEKTK